MTVRMTLSRGETPTPEQTAEIQEAGKYPITFDEDCPALMPKMQDAFRRAAAERNARLREQTRTAAQS